MRDASDLYEEKTTIRKAAGELYKSTITRAQSWSIAREKKRRRNRVHALLSYIYIYVCVYL